MVRYRMLQQYMQASRQQKAQISQIVAAQCFTQLKYRWQGLVELPGASQLVYRCFTCRADEWPKLLMGQDKSRLFQLIYEQAMSNYQQWPFSLLLIESLPKQGLGQASYATLSQLAQSAHCQFWLASLYTAMPIAHLYFVPWHRRFGPAYLYCCLYVLAYALQQSNWPLFCAFVFCGDRPKFLRWDTLRQFKRRSLLAQSLSVQSRKLGANHYLPLRIKQLSRQYFWCFDRESCFFAYQLSAQLLLRYLREVLVCYVGFSCSCDELQAHLQSWLNQFCSRSNHSAYPLQYARCDVKPLVVNSEHFEVSLQVSFSELSQPFSLVTQARLRR